MTHKNMRGFALLQILIMTLVMSGLIYLLLSGAQKQQRTLVDKDAGAQLAIAVTSLATQLVSRNGSCPLRPGSTSLKMTDCVRFGAGFNGVLDKYKINTATITITQP